MRVEHRPEQRGAGPGVAAYEDEGVAGAVVLPPCRAVVGEGGDSCSRKMFQSWFVLLEYQNQRNASRIYSFPSYLRLVVLEFPGQQ